MTEIAALLLPWSWSLPDEIVNPHCSRKTFLLKISGIVAAAGLAPRWLARTAPPRSVRRAGAAPAPIVPRPEPRSVPRSAGAR